MQNYASMGSTKKMLGVSSDSLRRWEKQGKINSIRSPGGHRYFLIDDINELKNKYQKKQFVPKKEIKIKKPIKPVYLYSLIGFAVLDIILIVLYFIFS